MKTKIISKYIDALIEAKLPNLKTIRLGTKALSYWPQRFVTDEDADDLLRLFEKVKKHGINTGIKVNLFFLKRVHLIYYMRLKLKNNILTRKNLPK